MLKNFLLLVLLLITSATALAQYDNPQKKERSDFGSRDGRFEGSVILAFQTGLSEESEGGASIDMDSSAGWGISFGWNWTAKLNLSYRLTANKPNYIAVIVPEDTPDHPQTFEQKMSKYSHQLNATYHFMDGSFTPYVVGGIGYAKLDSNIITGTPEVGCWWDPWWGYVCFSDWESYTVSKFSYNIGVGLRWDINNAFFSRASYSREFISLENGSIDFDTAAIEIGMMF